MIFIETDFGQCKFATLAASTRLLFAAFHKTLAVVASRMITSNAIGLT